MNFNVQSAVQVRHIDLNRSTDDDDQCMLVAESLAEEGTALAVVLHINGLSLLSAKPVNQIYTRRQQRFSLRIAEMLSGNITQCMILQRINKILYKIKT